MTPLSSMSKDSSWLLGDVLSFYNLILIAVDNTQIVVLEQQNYTTKSPTLFNKKLNSYNNITKLQTSFQSRHSVMLFYFKTK